MLSYYYALGLSLLMSCRSFADNNFRVITSCLPIPFNDPCHRPKIGGIDFENSCPTHFQTNGHNVTKWMFPAHLVKGQCEPFPSFYVRPQSVICHPLAFTFDLILRNCSAK